MKKNQWIICVMAILLASCGANLSAINPFQPTQTPVPPTPTQEVTCEELVERWNDSFAPMVVTFFPLVKAIPEGRMPAMSASDIDRVMRIQMGSGTPAPGCDSQIVEVNEGFASAIAHYWDWRDLTASRRTTDARRVEASLFEVFDPAMRTYASYLMYTNNDAVFKQIFGKTIAEAQAEQP
jgi:hypothetical protein